MLGARKNQASKRVEIARHRAGTDLAQACGHPFLCRRLMATKALDADERREVGEKGVLIDAVENVGFTRAEHPLIFTQLGDAARRRRRYASRARSRRDCEGFSAVIRRADEHR